MKSKGVSDMRNTYEEFLAESQARKTEAEKNENNEKHSNILYKTIYQNYWKKLYDIFISLENEIKKQNQLFSELDMFHDYKNLAYRIIMEIVNERYSPEILEQHEMRNML